MCIKYETLPLCDCALFCTNTTTSLTPWTPPVTHQTNMTVLKASRVGAEISQGERETERRKRYRERETERNSSLKLTQYIFYLL